MFVNKPFELLSLVGVPYTEGGMTPQGFSCWGLIWYVLKNQLGLEVPEKPPYSTKWPHYVKLHRPPDLPPPRPYDIIMFSDIIPGITNHMGVMISNKDFLHSSRPVGGVVCEPLTKHAKFIVALGRPKQP